MGGARDRERERERDRGRERGGGAREIAEVVSLCNCPWDMSSGISDEWRPAQDLPLEAHIAPMIEESGEWRCVSILGVPAHNICHMACIAVKGE